MTTEGTTLAPHSMHRTIVDLNDIVRDVVNSCAGRNDGGHIGVTLDLADNLPSVWADPRQLEQVLSILVRNAEEGINQNPRRPGEIHVQTTVEGERVHLTVTDNGRGMDSGEMARIFEDQDATVGLTVCTQLAKHHGGKLYAWSSYGNGSTFTLELPIHRRTDKERIQLGQAPEASSLLGKRILVVDDEIHITGLMVDVLATQGATIDLANSGLQAVEQIQTKKYDLFICDQRMPDFTGEQLFRTVEYLNPDLRNRFLFVTGDILSPETREFFTETGVQYIRKPFRSVELVQAVEEMLSRNLRLGF
jgi:CheY-like chemotaxis protein